MSRRKRKNRKRPGGWTLFKRTWLVPSGRYSRGLARWIWSAMDWWRYNMDTRNALSWISRSRRWCREKLLKWLTPQLHYARRFMEFCFNENGTRLISSDAVSFQVRTSGDDQSYFSGRANMLGMVRIYRTKWLDSTGRGVNLFSYGIMNGLLGNGSTEPLEKRTELVWRGWLLCEGQFRRAKREIADIEELDWCRRDVAIDRLCDEICPPDRFGFRRDLLRSVAEEKFGVNDYTLLFGTDAIAEFDGFIEKMTVGEAKRRLELER